MEETVGMEMIGWGCCEGRGWEEEACRAGRWEMVFVV